MSSITIPEYKAHFNSVRGKEKKVWTRRRARAKTDLVHDTDTESCHEARLHRDINSLGHLPQPRVTEKQQL